jgi:hypothetical protein
MTVNFKELDRVVSNLAYAEANIMGDCECNKQTISSLRYIESDTCIVRKIGKIPGKEVYRTFIRVSPINIRNLVWNKGVGTVMVFCCDEHLNNSLKLI